MNNNDFDKNLARMQKESHNFAIFSIITAAMVTGLIIFAIITTVLHFAS